MSERGSRIHSGWFESSPTAKTEPGAVTPPGNTGALPQTMSIPDFALAPTRPYPIPVNTRQKIYNHIYETLEEHPHRWFSITAVAEAIGASTQLAHRIIEGVPPTENTRGTPGIPDLLVIKKVQTPEMHEIVRNQVYDLIDRHYPIDRIQEELGVSQAWINDVFTPETPDEDADRFSKLRTREFVASLRKDARLGDSDITYIVSTVFPELPEFYANHLLENLRDENPTYRLRIPRGTLIGNQDAENRVTTLLSQGKSAREIFQLLKQDIENATFFGVVNLVRHIRNSRPDEVAKGLQIRRDNQIERTRQGAIAYHRRQKEIAQSGETQVPE